MPELNSEDLPVSLQLLFIHQAWQRLADCQTALLLQMSLLTELDTQICGPMLNNCSTTAKLLNRLQKRHSVEIDETAHRVNIQELDFVATNNRGYWTERDAGELRFGPNGEYLEPIPEWAKPMIEQERLESEQILSNNPPLDAS